MNAQFAAQGVTIDKVYNCPHHPLYGAGIISSCLYRKPNPGMILRARDEHGIRLRNSVLVGDNEWDIMAAKAAGIGATGVISDHVPASQSQTSVPGRQPQ